MLANTRGLAFSYSSCVQQGIDGLKSPAATQSHDDVVAESLVRLLAGCIRWVHIPGDVWAAFAGGWVSLPALLAEGLGLCPLRLSRRWTSSASPPRREPGSRRRSVAFHRPGPRFPAAEGELVALTGLTFETLREIVEVLAL